MAFLKGLTVPTILVADDNSNIQKMVSLVFKEKGIRVVAVGNGEAACRKVPEVHPDVVLADVFMPVRNGYEVCEFVKQDPQFAETPVILLVGAFDPLDEKEAQRVGANGVLKKPFVPPEPLITMVSSMLKIEPVAEEPPPPAPDEASRPQNRAESGPTARQRAIASAQAQYSEMGEDEAVTAFSAPVAVPSSRDQEIEEADLDPASEWTKRRATMDYEIDAADSADMVEKLAAQGDAAEEPEVQAASKHVPFGGANIEGILGESVQEASSSPWPDTANDTAIEQMPSAARGHETHEFSVAADADEAAEMPAEANTTSEPAHENVFEFDSPAPILGAPWETAVTQEGPAAAGQETILETPTELVPEIHISQSSAEDHVPAVREPFNPFRKTEKIASPLEERSASHSFAKPVSPSPAPSEDIEVGSVEKPAVESAAIEAAAKEAALKPGVDQATVDDVVAKVISKLEPHLHQALANGVLRPLVEEVLNQQREKK